MRLIHSSDLTFKEFYGNNLPKYAILSHCWNDNEVTYQDFLNRRESQSGDLEWKKIFDCCSLAKGDDIEWIWLDTCCIDKSSSAELSEAINSMFGWYKKAYVCYVFLSDLDTNWKNSTWLAYNLFNCRWFTRGWTLQELIGPENIRFFDGRMQCIGSKTELASDLAHVTKIPSRYLLGTDLLQSASVSQRMSAYTDGQKGDLT